MIGFNYHLTSLSRLAIVVHWNFLFSYRSVAYQFSKLWCYAGITLALKLVTAYREFVSVPTSMSPSAPLPMSMSPSTPLPMSMSPSAPLHTDLSLPQSSSLHPSQSFSPLPFLHPHLAPFSLRYLSAPPLSDYTHTLSPHKFVCTPNMPNIKVLIFYQYSLC